MSTKFISANTPFFRFFISICFGFLISFFSFLFSKFSLFDLNSARIYDGLKMYLVTSYKTDFFDLIKAKLEELCSEIKILNVEEKKEKEEK